MNFEEFKLFNFEDQIRLFCNKELLLHYFKETDIINNYINNIINEYKIYSNQIILDIEINKNKIIKDSIINNYDKIIFCIEFSIYNIQNNKIFIKHYETDLEGFNNLKINFNQNFIN